jgi:hypothetical protein
MTKVNHPAGASKIIYANMPGKIILFCSNYPTKFVGYYRSICNSPLFTGSYFADAAPAVVCREALYIATSRMGTGPNIFR